MVYSLGFLGRAWGLMCRICGLRFKVWQEEEQQPEGWDMKWKAAPWVTGIYF